MDARAPLLFVLLLGSLLTGCIGDAGERLDPAAGTPSALDPSDVVVPPGARLEVIEDGVRLAWSDVALPFAEEITLPEGATVVRASAELGTDDTLSVALRHADTGRSRCQAAAVAPGWQSVRGTRSCAGLTALDPLPTTWRLTVSSQAEAARLVTLDLLAVPLDGLVGQLDLTQLSMPEHVALETEELKLPSHDGTPLHVELTRPDTEEPVPAVIVSSPYNTLARALGGRAEDSLIRDWVPRGYAIVVADVRGFGKSGGCVEVWGENEQLDQALLVDWVAEQPWSSGSVGFYGVSYVGTTPIEAAVHAPQALKAIVPIAGVVDAYNDWHHGGVPTGENTGSPAAYQAIGSVEEIEPGDPLATALRLGSGLCDPTLTARANDPRATYDAFYEERNFSAMAANIRAAVLMGQGFEDGNVKSSMTDPFFNALTSPKLGLFGHWAHQHPARTDWDTLLLAWMDQYVRDRPVGFDDVANVSVLADEAVHRTADAWPPADAERVTFYPDLAAGTLGSTPSDASARLFADPTGLVTVPGEDVRTVLVLAGPVEEALHLAGRARVELFARAATPGNAMLEAELYELRDGERTRIAYGQANLAHRNGHDSFEPMTAAEEVRMGLRMLPTEYRVEAGSELVLVLRGVPQTDTFGGVVPPAVIELLGGEDGTRMVLPTVPLDEAAAAPVTIG